jgi:hypothetical protein
LIWRTLRRPSLRKPQRLCVNGTSRTQQERWLGHNGRKVGRNRNGRKRPENMCLHFSSCFGNSGHSQEMIAVGGQNEERHVGTRMLYVTAKFQPLLACTHERTSLRAGLLRIHPLTEESGRKTRENTHCHPGQPTRAEIASNNA